MTVKSKLAAKEAKRASKKTASSTSSPTQKKDPSITAPAGVEPATNLLPRSLVEPRDATQDARRKDVIEAVKANDATGRRTHVFNAVKEILKAGGSPVNFERKAATFWDRRQGMVEAADLCPALRKHFVLMSCRSTNAFRSMNVVARCEAATLIGCFHLPPCDGRRPPLLSLFRCTQTTRSQSRSSLSSLLHTTLALQTGF